MNRYAERLARLESLACAAQITCMFANVPALVVLRRRAGHPENPLLAEAARALYVRDYGHAPPAPNADGVLYLDLEP